MIRLDKAQEIISKHQSKWPVPVVKIARDMGLEVFTVKDWPKELSGKLTKEENGFVIYINADHSKVRQRFTIAHEIAHFVLHSNLIKDEIIDDALYRSGLTNLVETQANSYATDILMPWDLVNEAIRQNIETIETLAEVFNVSNSAMSIRLGVPFESKVVYP